MKEKETHPFNKLAKPAQWALANAGISSLEQLANLTEAEFMKLHGIGKNALHTLKNTMAEKGLAFAIK